LRIKELSQLANKGTLYPEKKNNKLALRVNYSTKQTIKQLLVVLSCVGLALVGQVPESSGGWLECPPAVVRLSQAKEKMGLCREMGRAAKRRAAKVADQIPQWEMAIVRWYELYYCARDDGVFDPDEGVFVPIEEMMDYLYR
jgi:hypothetical protein